MEKTAKISLVVTGVIILLVTITSNIYYTTQLKTENIDFTWMVTKKIPPYSSENDLSNELNTIGENQSFTYLSNISAKPSDYPNVLLISLDGFSRQRFNELKDNLTTIHTLISSGWIQLNVTNYVNLTQTRNGHTTMLSGYLGKDTGIMGNKYVYHQLPTGYTFLEKAENKYGSNGIATGFISGKYKNIYPAFNTTALKTLDYVHIQEQVPQDTGDQCIKFLETYKDSWFTAFFHFRDPDKTGHLHREGSEEWLNSTRIDDQQLGRIIQELNQTGALNHTKIYITTDHGFKIDGWSHKHEHNIWLLTNDRDLEINSKSNMIGEQDVAPTICEVLDLQYNSSTPDSGQPLQQSFSSQKITYREQYLIDKVRPQVAILKAGYQGFNLIVQIQIPNDVNQLYLMTNSNDYQAGHLN